MLDIYQFSCLKDNYGFVIVDQASGLTAAIDAPDADAIVAQMESRDLAGLDLLLNTHWHPDHTGGNAALKAHYGCTVIAPDEVRKVADVDRVIRPDEIVMLGETRLEVLDLGGHTHNLIGYYSREDKAAFIADALFVLGCGRLFEGTADQMWASCERLMALPEDTRLFCAHEYTMANLAFARSLDDFSAFKPFADRAHGLEARIAASQPTVPTTIGEEKASNPFLVLPLRETGRQAQVRCFAALRTAKDVFKS